MAIKIDQRGESAWFDRIKSACEDAGTYQPFFDIVIGELAGIMDTRDAAQEQYRRSGGNPVVGHTNKGGHTNLTKNPCLKVIQECNTQALAYWRELGLTPSGFKKIQGTAAHEKETSFEELLEGIGI